MAHVTLLSDHLGAAALSESGDSYRLGPGATHSATSDGAVLNLEGWADQTGYSVQVDGTMAHLGRGNVIESVTYDVRWVSITISETGRILGLDNWRGVSLHASEARLTNAGEITAAEAVRLSGDASSLINSGRLASAYEGFSPVYAANLSGSGARVENTGEIVGPGGVNITADGVLTNTGTITADATAVRFSTSNVQHLVVLENAGTITGGDYAVDSVLGTDHITNTGEIHGTVDTGSASDTILNDGLISGLVRTGNGDDAVINSDMILGEVQLGMGDDVYVARKGGVATGGIDGANGDDDLRGSRGDDLLDGGLDADTLRASGGDDTLLGGDGADVLRGGGGADRLDGGAGPDRLLGNGGSDHITGGGGEDTLRGARGDDTLSGEAENDVLRGNGGSDVLQGGDGRDKLYGNSADDTLSGGDGEDRLRGQGGNDLMQGDAGRDDMRGGGGNDTLDGGAGADRMDGGQGADVFRFDAVEDSPLYDEDFIYDFKPGVDLLDFDGLVSGALVFSETGAHAAEGTASVRYLVLSGNAHVYIDADGDGASDMEIVLGDVSGLMAEDFIL
jgi:Ca2+-binding RTX toxin-like protein